MEPKWNNKCGHGPGCFVGSFDEQTISGGKIQTYDLYVFPSNYFGTEVCIRYGNECSEYISPTSIIQMARVHDNKVYNTALRMIEDEFKIKLERRV